MFILCNLGLLLIICLTHYLSIEWNSIRLDGPAHGIVTKTAHKTLPGGGGGEGGGEGPVGGGGCRGWWGGWSLK